MPVELEVFVLLLVLLLTVCLLFAAGTESVFGRRWRTDWAFYQQIHVCVCVCVCVCVLFVCVHA